MKDLAPLAVDFTLTLPVPCVLRAPQPRLRHLFPFLSVSDLGLGHFLPHFAHTGAGSSQDPSQLGTEISDGSFFPLRVSESSSFPIGFFSALKTVTPAHRRVCVCDMVSGVVQETISNTVSSSWQHVRCKISVAGEPRVLGQVRLHLTAVLVQTGRTWTE